MGRLTFSTPEQWEEISAVFSLIADLPKKERSQRLVQLALENPEIAQEVIELLEEDTGPHPLLGKDVHQFQTIDDESLLNAQITAFTLTRLIGSGGMGSVFEARRSDGEFEQKVAIKLIRAGTWSEQSLSLFRHERQILASLQHPNIARLYDGGVIDSKRPFFTMELVDGMAITDYVQSNALTVRERVWLFLQVIDAVQYAHQKLILHLDIKPANIQVNDEGQVKLLDFGISRILTGKTPPDDSQKQKAFTPAYAAPEQLQGEPLSTATDVYGLGMILYELLAGNHPFIDQQAFKEAPYSFPEKFVPAAPSQSVSPENADCIKHLEGDLDAIVLKALKKNVEDRYPSVEAMAADLNAYLRKYPVSARKLTSFYLLSKYLKRHRKAVSLSSFFIILLIGSGVFYVLEINRQKEVAMKEAERARQIKELTLDIFRQANPAESQRSDLTAQQVLDNSLKSLPTKLRSQPSMLIEMYGVIASSYMNLGLYDAALSTNLIALHLGDSLYQRPDLRIAKAILNLGIVYSMEYVDLDKADSLKRLAYRMIQESSGTDPELEALAITEMGVSAYERQFYDEADSLLQQGLKMYQALEGDYQQESAFCLHMLGTTYRKLESWDKSEDYLLRAKAAYEEIFSPPHVELALNQNHLASLYLNTNQPEKAEYYAKSALEQRRHIFGDTHMETLASLSNLGRIYKSVDRWEDALSVYREVFKNIKMALGESHPYVSATMSNLAGILVMTGQVKEAEQWYRQAIAMEDTLLAADDFRRSYSLQSLGRLLLDEQRPKDAYPYLASALQIRETQLPEGHSQVALLQAALGECLLAMAKEQEAQVLLDVALQAYAQDTVMHREAISKIHSLKEKITEKRR